MSSLSRVKGCSTDSAFFTPCSCVFYPFVFTLPHVSTLPQERRTPLPCSDISTRYLNCCSTKESFASLKEKREDGNNRSGGCDASSRAEGRAPRFATGRSAPPAPPPSAGRGGAAAWRRAAGSGGMGWARSQPCALALAAALAVCAFYYLGGGGETFSSATRRLRATRAAAPPATPPGPARRERTAAGGEAGRALHLLMMFTKAERSPALRGKGQAALRSLLRHGRLRRGDALHLHLVTDGASRDIGEGLLRDALRGAAFRHQVRRGGGGRGRRGREGAAGGRRWAGARGISAPFPASVCARPAAALRLPAAGTCAPVLRCGALLGALLRP